MVTRVGYFCTAGHTEAGGIRQFLEKIHPDIVWLRRFPAYDKPAPKLGRTLPAPRSTDEGCTGDKLVDKMLERIALYYQGAACDPRRFWERNLGLRSSAMVVAMMRLVRPAGES